jgi:Ser/Thr protein kinase RdoA (MazF antagonist)
MERRIKERFNDSILREAMQRYGIASDQIHLLDGFESFMFEFERDSGSYILRIAHSLRRNENLIKGEVDWINFLDAGGASVAQAILSDEGRLVEAVDDGRGGSFLVTAFAKAPGRAPWEVGWSPDLSVTYGQLLGRIHALSKGYRLTNPAWKRPEWDDELMLDIEGNLPTSEDLVVDRFRALRAHLENLPRDPQSYGMIHFDAHRGNLFVDETGRITLFDFDDCHHSWYANDVAIVLFYMVVNTEDAAAVVAEFMPHFLRGYRRENRLDARWLQEMPYFLKLREIDLYAVIHRSFDVNNLDDPWCSAFMKGRKERIENDVPYVAFQFASLAEYL